jgi:hypothetical protein
VSIRTASVLSLGLALAAGLPLSAQEAVVLRLDPPVGQVIHQSMESKTWMAEGSTLPSDTAPPTMTMRMFSTQTVAAAEPGIRTITTVIDSSHVEMGGGMPMPGMSGDIFKSTTNVKRVNDDGDVLSSTVTPGPNLPPMMAGRMPDMGEANRHTYPKRPLRVGDTWTDTVTVPAGPGGATATNVVTTRLVSLEQQEGALLATLSSTSSGGVPADSARATSVTGESTSETILDVTHRRLVRMTNETRTRVESPRGTATTLGRLVIVTTEP